MRYLQEIKSDIYDAKSKAEMCKMKFEDFKTDFREIYSNSNEATGGYLILWHFVFALVLFFMIFFKNSTFLSGLFGLAALITFFIIIGVSNSYISNKNICFKATRRHFAYSTASLILLVLSGIAFVKCIVSNIDFEQCDGNTVGEFFISLTDIMFDNLPYYFYGANSILQSYLFVLTATMLPLVLILLISSLVKFVKCSAECKRLSYLVDLWKNDFEHAEYEVKRLEEELSDTEYDLKSQFNTEMQKGSKASVSAIKEIAKYGLDEARKWVQNQEFELKMSNKIVDADKILKNKEYHKYAQAMKMLDDVIKHCKKKEPELYNLAISSKSKLKSSIKAHKPFEIYVVAVKMSEYSSLNDYALELFQLAANQKDPDAIKKINAYIEAAEKIMYSGNYSSAIKTFEILKNAGNAEAKELWRKANDLNKQEEIAKQSNHTFSYTSSFEQNSNYTYGYGELTSEQLREYNRNNLHDLWNPTKIDNDPNLTEDQKKQLKNYNRSHGD